MTGLQAHEMGLVTGLVPLPELDAEIELVAQRIAGAGPVALRATKRHLNGLDADRLAEAVRRGARISADVIAGAEAQRLLAKAYG